MQLEINDFFVVEKQNLKLSSFVDLSKLEEQMEEQLEEQLKVRNELNEQIKVQSDYSGVIFKVLGVEGNYVAAEAIHWPQDKEITFNWRPEDKLRLFDMTKTEVFTLSPQFVKIFTSRKEQNENMETTNQKT